MTAERAHFKALVIEWPTRHETHYEYCFHILTDSYNAGFSPTWLGCPTAASCSEVHLSADKKG